MKLEYLSEAELKKMISEAVAKHLPLSDCRLFFFGSRVRGDNFPRSDIDIGIESKKKLSSEVKFAIEGELEKLPVLYKIELVDFRAVSADFKREALKFRQRIN